MEIKKSNKAAVKVYDRVIEKTDYSSERLEGTYESVEFRSCTFDDVSGINFTDCLFTSCNLSNAEISKCKLQDVTFRDCKLIGINFFQALDFGFHILFENCMLDYCSFATKKMNKSASKTVNFMAQILHRLIFQKLPCPIVTFWGHLRKHQFKWYRLHQQRNFNIDPQLNQSRKPNSPPPVLPVYYTDLTLSLNKLKSSVKRC